MSEIQNININKFELKLADTDDPVAQKVDWQPAKGGGTNFRAQQIIFEQNRVQIKKSFGAIFFYSVFLIVGLAALLIGFPYFSMVKNETGPSIIMLIMGLTFGGFATFLLTRKQYCLDKTTNTYYKGKPDRFAGTQDKQKQGSLSDIHAIQLISETIRGEKRSYVSYELNLVLKDAQRVNLMDHGDNRAIQQDAKALAEFLNVPIWQAEY